MYGNMNPGLMICLMKAEDTGNVIEKGKATLTRVQTDVTFGGSLPLFDTTGKSVWVASAESDNSGIAFVEFLWDPTHIGHFIEESPLAVIASRNSDTGETLEIKERGTFSDTKEKRDFIAMRHGVRLHLCVNLGQALKSGKGDFQFKEPTSKTIDALKFIQKLLEFRAKVKGEKIPKLQILKVMRPSVEMYALLGVAEIKMKPV